MKRVTVSQSAAWLFIATVDLTPFLAAAADNTIVHCSTPEKCCDSLRCARGPCSSSPITTGSFFINMPTHFTFYGVVPSLTPVLLALELLLVRIFGACVDCLRPCGTYLKSERIPSSHSASSIGMWLWVFLETFVGVGKSLPQRIKIYITLTNALLFAPVPYSRVHLGDHAPLQTAIGIAVGVVFAVLYFLILRLVIDKKLDRASQWLAAERRCCPIVIENDYYYTKSSLYRADDEELEQALIGQPYATYG